uniref:Cytochrome P450 307A2 n=1 Tax=Maconellicoccus hirsutus TaxID=177089 RepID=A0AAT9UTJ9_MACHI
MYATILFALYFSAILSLFFVYKYLTLTRIKSTIKGPNPLPIIGSLHLLGKYPTPFEGFTALSKIYGDIYSIYLGSARCVVVNNFALIKEVLIKKGVQFGGRPNYLRYHKLFGGDRNNSLALCDWSSLQETRRHIARIYCSPRFTSYNYQLLDTVSSNELDHFIVELQSKCIQDRNVINLKPIVLAACANMFTQYMCTTRFPYDMQSFQNIVRYYDEVFWDINQGYAVDFMPWLAPFYNRHMNKLAWWAGEVRKFILSNVVDVHLKTIDYDEPPRDFTDALLQNLKTDSKLNWQHILFELEDFLGGHSAVGNLVMLTLFNLVKYPYVKKRIEEEIKTVTAGSRKVGLFDKNQMVYTEATIFETLRATSSPIVPHVATQDTELGGHFVEKGTCIILNNYELNKSNEYWENPSEFLPERFIRDGKVVKPAHFIPFGTGKRTCIGQQLVSGFSFVLVAGIVQHFEVELTNTISPCTKAACVALPPDTFPIILKPKSKD